MIAYDQLVGEKKETNLMLENFNALGNIYFENMKDLCIL